MILVEFDPDFCRLLRTRYPAATVVQGDAYRLRRLLDGIVREPAAAIVSGLPLVTKPPRTRLRLISDAMGLLKKGAPFVQFTYAMRAADPEGAVRHQGRMLRADLAEYSAGAGLGLSRHGMIVAQPLPNLFMAGKTRPFLCLGWPAHDDHEPAWYGWRT